MTLIETLELNGFAHVENDEPHEDYWLLDRYGHGPDLLVERESDGWRVCRTPVDDEPRAEWVDIASDLGEDACIAVIEGLL